MNDKWKGMLETCRIAAIGFIGAVGDSTIIPA